MSLSAVVVGESGPYEHAQAYILLASLFLITGIVNLFWPQWILSRLERKSPGSWRLGLILSPFPEKHRPTVVRVLGALCLLVAAVGFSEAWMPK